MKKKTSTNAITSWLEALLAGRMGSQTHQVENNDDTILNVFLPNRTPQEELKNFKFANSMYH